MILLLCLSRLLTNNSLLSSVHLKSTHPEKEAGNYEKEKTHKANRDKWTPDVIPNVYRHD